MKSLWNNFKQGWLEEAAQQFRHMKLSQPWHFYPDAKDFWIRLYKKFYGKFQSVEMMAILSRIRNGPNILVRYMEIQFSLYFHTNAIFILSGLSNDLI